MEFKDLEVGMKIQHENGVTFDRIVTAIGEEEFLVKVVDSTMIGEILFDDDLKDWSEIVEPFLVVCQLYEHKLACDPVDVILSHIGEHHVLFHYADIDEVEQCLTIEDFTDMYRKAK